MNKWVQERAQFALEKRGKMSQLQQQKAMREEQNRRENKRLKEIFFRPTNKNKRY